MASSRKLRVLLLIGIVAGGYHWLGVGVFFIGIIAFKRYELLMPPARYRKFGPDQIQQAVDLQWGHLQLAGASRSRGSPSTRDPLFQSLLRLFCRSAVCSRSLLFGLEGCDCRVLEGLVEAARRSGGDMVTSLSTATAPSMTWLKPGWPYTRMPAPFAHAELI